MDINISGIIAQRFKMTIIFENITTNVQKDEETGLPYQKIVELEAADIGVKVTGVESTEPFGRYFDPQLLNLMKMVVFIFLTLICPMK